MREDVFIDMWIYLKSKRKETLNVNCNELKQNEFDNNL